ncbi:hypothetical protein MKW92_034093 [Papaver armeniacum]|nr:hypothetical protein MKW92_034093 [Papaver armeniacum]
MDPEASRNARESLELDSNVKHSGNRGFNPESLAALVKDLIRESQTNPTTTPAAPTFP